MDHQHDFSYIKFIMGQHLISFLAQCSQNPRTQISMAIHFCRQSKSFMLFQVQIHLEFRFLIRFLGHGLCFAYCSNNFQLWGFAGILIGFNRIQLNPVILSLSSASFNGLVNRHRSAEDSKTIQSVTQQTDPLNRSNMLGDAFLRYMEIAMIDAMRASAPNPGEPAANSDLQIFESGEFQVRAVSTDGEPWFVLSDICQQLGLVNPREAKRTLDSEDVNSVNTTRKDGQVGPVNIVSEAGLYTLVLKSRKAEAKQFQRWLCKTVIPQIRKTGGYGVQQINDETVLEVITHLQQRIADQQKSWDRVDATEGSYTLTEAAKLLECHPQAFNQWLNTQKWIYKPSKRWIAYQDKVNTGLLEHSVVQVTKPDGTPIEPIQCRVLPKGMRTLSEKLTREASSLPSNLLIPCSELIPG